MSGTPDQRLAAVADAQRGRISYAQLLVIGITPAMIRARASRGSLRPVHHGVYAVGHLAAVELGEEMAALLAAGRGGCLAARSAAWLWQLTHGRPDQVEIILPRARYARSRPGIRILRSGTLAPADIVVHRGLPITTPARALLDLADDATPRQLERALDEGLAQRLVSRTKVEEQLARSGAGRRGAGKLAALVALRRPSSITRSPPEERLLAILRRARVATPETQVALNGFTADFLWREAGVVVEVDGFQWHSTRSAFRRDRRKDRAFRDAGLEVIRVTTEEIEDEPLALVARIARTVAQRTAARVA